MEAFLPAEDERSDRNSPVQPTPATKTSRGNRTWKNITVRLYADEYLILVALREALSDPGVRVETTFLLRTAAVEEATLLGFSPAAPRGDPSVTARPKVWKYAALERDRENYSEQLTITAHPLELTALENAAEWANVKLPRFIIGSLLRFAAKRKHADPANPKLLAIPVPPQFSR